MRCTLCLHVLPSVDHERGGWRGGRTYCVPESETIARAKTTTTTLPPPGTMTTRGNTDVRRRLRARIAHATVGRSVGTIRTREINNSCKTVSLSLTHSLSFCVDTRSSWSHALVCCCCCASAVGRPTGMGVSSGGKCLRAT